MKCPACANTKELSFVLVESGRVLHPVHLRGIPGQSLDLARHLVWSGTCPGLAFVLG